MAPSLGEQSPAPPRERGPVEVIASELRAKMLHGELGPNERLIEEDLARAHGTNRAVVRGALARLEQERLIVREPNRGARVRSFTAEEAAEILETRAVLEGLVARCAAARIDDNGIATLGAIIEAMTDCHARGDLLAYSQLNARFHRAILEIAQHETAAHMLSQLQSQSVRYQFRTVLEPGRAAKSLSEHQRIYLALQKRDADDAERAVREHIRNVIDTVRAVATSRTLL
jgi:DNA-binding GntR family transcriptional regulator